MYIPEFWVGVITTILIETLILILMICVSAYRDKEDKDENSVN